MLASVGGPVAGVTLRETGVEMDGEMVVSVSFNFLPIDMPSSGIPWSSSELLFRRLP